MLTSIVLAALVAAAPPGEPAEGQLGPGGACQVWISAPDELGFGALRDSIRSQLAGASTVDIREWRLGETLERGVWWFQISQTGGQWRLAFRSVDGGVAMRDIPLLEASSIEAEIGGEIALVAHASCGLVGSGATKSRPDMADEQPREPHEAPVAGERRSRARLRGHAWLGASLAMSAPGLVVGAIGFARAFVHYRNFNRGVVACVVDGSMPATRYGTCRLQSSDALMANHYWAGVGSVGAAMLGLGLVLAIPATVELRRARRGLAPARLTGSFTPGPSGAVFGVSLAF